MEGRDGEDHEIRGFDRMYMCMYAMYMRGKKSQGCDWRR